MSSENVKRGVVKPLPPSLVALRCGSLRGRLVWLGTLAYLAYAYLEFAVSPPFTALYLLYVGAFACAIPALLLGGASIDTRTLPSAFDSRAPRRAAGLFSLAVGTLLAAAWLKGIVARTLAGEFGWPQGADAIGHVVRALDLGLQVPLGIAAGILLLRRRPSGYLLGAISLVNGVCMGAALTAMVAWSAIVSGQRAIVAMPFAVLPLAALSLGIPFFRAARPDQKACSTHVRDDK